MGGDARKEVSVGSPDNAASHHMDWDLEVTTIIDDVPPAERNILYEVAAEILEELWVAPDTARRQASSLLKEIFPSASQACLTRRDPKEDESMGARSELLLADSLEAPGVNLQHRILP